MFEFSVISGSTVKLLLDECPTRTLDHVRHAYLAHHDGHTVNPDSYFLRYPAKPSSRIIALPASIDGEPGISGLKWIASFPDNIKQGIPRASAVLLLNDQKTGYPLACLEASLISAARTAASAVLGAYWLNQCERRAYTLALVGAGVIARSILDMFIADGWQFDAIHIHDIDAVAMEAFVAHASARAGFPAIPEDELASALEADIVVFATNAGEPYVLPPARFAAGQIVLNVSLRDIAPDLILDAENVVDDVDHCLKANTSPHLAEQRVGHRDFVTGSLAQLIRGEITLNRERALIFSPFGMGILDLAVGHDLYQQALERGLDISIPHFFGETRRW